MKMTIDEFLYRNDISYTLPGQNNHLYMGKVNENSQFSLKQYRLWAFHELHCLIIKEADMEGIKFSSLNRSIKFKKEYIHVIKTPSLKKVSCLFPDCENRATLCGYQTCNSWSKLVIKLSWASGSNCIQTNNTSLHWWIMPELSNYWLRMYKRLWQHNVL